MWDEERCFVSPAQNHRLVCIFCQMKSRSHPLGPRSTAWSTKRSAEEVRSFDSHLLRRMTGKRSRGSSTSDKGRGRITTTFGYLYCRFRERFQDDVLCFVLFYFLNFRRKKSTLFSIPSYSNVFPVLLGSILDFLLCQ